MPKFSPLLSIAALSLVIAGCQPAGQAPEKSPASAKNAPVKSASTPESNDAAALPVLALPMVNIENLSQAFRNAEDAFSIAHFEGVNQKQAGALEWYLAILRFDGNNEKAKKGLENTFEALILVTRKTIRDGNLGEARRLLQVMRSSLVPHPEIALLNAEYESARQADAWQQKAVALEKRKLVIESDSDQPENNAVATYRKAIKAFPEYQPAVMAIDRLRSQRERAALILAKQSKFEAALIALKQAESIDAENPQYQMIASHVHGRLNQNIQEKIVLANLALDGLRIFPAQEYYVQAREILPLHPGVVALEKRLDEVKHYGRYKPGQVFTDAWAMSTPAPEMVVIPYGKFEMGSRPELPLAVPAEMPRHAVRFKRGFAIARNEITVSQFRQFIESSGYRTRANTRGWSMVFDEKGGSMTKRENIDWRHDHLGRLAKDELPVAHINLHDAAAYVKWLSEKTGVTYRLPSEAEFEYVLRAGNDTLYPWGDAPPTKVVGNLAGAGDKSVQSRSWGNAIPDYRDFHWGAAPVRSFPRERWGTFDISGNLEEWVQDCWHDSYQRAPDDGSAWVNPGCKTGVTRGASWASSLNEARVGFRTATLQKTHNASIGFRVVRPL